MKVLALQRQATSTWISCCVLGFFLIGVSVLGAEDRLSTIIESLGSDRYSVREQGSKDLSALLTEDVLQLLPLRESFQRGSDPEVRHRILECVLSDVPSSVLNRPHGALGFSYDLGAEDTAEGGKVSGFRVNMVRPGGGGDKAGVKVGDLVIAFGEWKLDAKSGPSQIPGFMAQHYAGQEMRLTIISEGVTREVAAILTVRGGHVEWISSAFRERMHRWLLSKDPLPGY